MEFYQGVEFKPKIWVGEFYLYSLFKSRNYDLIHIHALYKLVPILRKFYSRKKIILHYHGSDCRITPPEKRVKAEKMSNKILLSTPDLIKFVPEGEYVPNPIDTKLFNYKKPTSTKAFTILVRENKLETIQNFLSENNHDIKFDVIYSGKSPIPYRNMPNLFYKYGTYIDLKFSYDGKIIPAMSNTGRQALACGLKILNYDLKYLEKFPDEYRPENVVSILEKIYGQL
ncbi:MAG TPA: hypothetical protein VMW74_05325 [Nitrosopumilaceae archaeon]|nr:hypothetical protein [Nitrosopumilaceae archaeon]